MEMTIVDDYISGLRYDNPIPIMTRVRLYSDNNEINEYLIKLALHSFNESIDIDMLNMIIQNDKKALHNNVMFLITTVSTDKIFNYISEIASSLKISFDTNDTLIFDNLHNDVLQFLKVRIT